MPESGRPKRLSAASSGCLPSESHHEEPSPAPGQDPKGQPAAFETAAIAALRTLIRAFRWVISPLLGACCRFEPSCSRYAEQCLRRHGLGRGSYLALRRLLRCHPWHAGGLDPVPVASGSAGRADSIAPAATLGENAYNSTDKRVSPWRRLLCLVVPGVLGTSALLWPDMAVAAPPTGAPEPVPSPSQTKVTLRSDRLAVAFSARDTALTSAKLLGRRFQDTSKEGAELVTTDQPGLLPLHFELGNRKLDASKLSWRIVRSSRGEPQQLDFVHEDESVRIVRSYRLDREHFRLRTTLEVTNRGSKAITLTPTVATHHYVPREATEGQGLFGGLGARSPFIGEALCRDKEGTERGDRDDLEKRFSRQDAPRFVATANTYFALALVPMGQGVQPQRCSLHATSRGGTVEEPEGTLFEASLEYPKTTLAPGESVRYRLMAFAGPKTYSELKAAGHELTELVDLGFFSFIGSALVRLLSWLYGMLGNWGLAIVALTVLVKLVLYPLTEKSFRSMAQMRVLKPEMDRINALYKDQREQKAAAVMELYRRNKINPLGGCLPSLLQLPIWFSLYTSLSTNVELYHAPFALWWTDLSSPDPYFVLPLAVGALMFLQQKLTPTTMDPAQAKMMLYFMPVMVTSFMLFLPSGLCLYMVTNSALGMVQQISIRRRLEAHARKHQSEGKPVKSKPTTSTSPQGGSEQAGRSQARRNQAKPTQAKAASPAARRRPHRGRA